MIRKILIFFLLIIVVPPAIAVGVLDRESCFYNGKKLDKGIAEETSTKTPKVAEDFSGKAVCYDLRENRRTEEVEIKNGKKHGWEQRFSRTSGKLSEEIYYVDDERHGVMKRYDHRNDGLQQEMNYEHGKLAGIQKEYFSENGQLKRIQWVEKERSNNKKTEVYFNKDGSLSMLSCGKQVISTQDARWCGRNGERNEVVLYSQSEDKNWPREVRHYKNNVLDGEVIKLHRQGHMMHKEVYANGEKVSSESFENGKPVHIQKYEAGKRSGEEVAYFEGTDQVKIAVEWKDSKKLKQVEFYQNGQPKETQLFKDDVVAITHYRENGNKYSEGEYEERGSYWWPYTSPQGVVKYYSEEGHLIEEASYDYGRLNGERKLYDSQELYREEVYEKGDLVNAKDYDRYGQPIRDTHFHPDGSVKKVIEIPPSL